MVKKVLKMVAAYEKQSLRNLLNLRQKKIMSALGNDANGKKTGPQHTIEKIGE